MEERSAISYQRSAVSYQPSAVSGQLAAEKGFEAKSEAFGFTLIELLVTISIISILAAVGMITYARVQSNARDSKRLQDIQAISQAIQASMQSNNGLFSSTYISASNGYVSVKLSGLVPTYMTTLPDDPKCATAGQSPCYQITFDAAPSTKFGLWAVFENAPSNGTSSCATNGVVPDPAPSGYNYCYTP